MSGLFYLEKRMFDSIHMKRWLETDESRAEFAVRFRKLHDSDNDRYGDLIERFISQLVTINNKIKTGTLLLNNDPLGITPEFLAEHDSRVATSFRLSNLIGRIRDEIHDNGSCGNAWAIIRLSHDKVLGTVRNIGRLRGFISALDRFDDNSEIMSWMCDQYDIFRCDDCDEYEYSSKGVTTYNESNICRECAGSYYTYSEYYGSHVHNDYTRTALDRNGNEVTIHCDDDDFNYDDDEDQYVHYDYELTPKVLGSYHASKGHQRPIVDDWSNSRSRWLGVELECEVRNEDIKREDKASQLNELINQGEVGKRVFFETDGSLNYGIEIISQPMSLPMHQDVWRWLENKDAVRYMRSHNTTTCGLHVHVSREPLTQDQIAKMVLFVNDRSNEPLIKAIARRYAEGYCRIKEKSLDNCHHSSDRYEAINITSEKTVEFRIFKGSLKYESVMAAIEFANALTEFTAKPSVGIADLTTEKFVDFINDEIGGDTTTLVPYINNRLELA